MSKSIVLRNDMPTSFLNMHGEETRNPGSESSHSPWKIIQTQRQRTRGVGRENANKPIAIPRVSSPSNKPSDSQPNPSYNFHMLRAEEHEVVTKASTDASSRPLAKSRNSDVAREGETQELPLPHGTYTDCMQTSYKPSCPLTSTVTPRLTSPSEIEMNRRCYVLPEQK